MHRPLALSLVLLSRASLAQTPPALNPASHPPHAAPGDALAITRAYAAERHEASVLLAYIDDAPGARGELRTALFTASAQGLDRQRADALIAPSARTVALAWDGTRGALAYIVPLPPPPQPAPGTPPHRFVSTPPSPTEPLGATMSSGGDVFVQPLDANGLPDGRPVSVFSEHSHAVRVAVALEPDRVVVAWTGAMYTDTEVRETVRAARLGPHHEAPALASNTGWSGDTGDALRLRADGGLTRLYFTGMRCLARDGTHTPSAPPQDPSARIEPANRSPQPQASITLDTGPLIECGPLGLHAATLDAQGAFGPLTASPPLTHDTFAFVRDGVIAPLGASPGALAVLPFELGESFRPVSARAPSLPVTVRPYAVIQQERPAPDAEPVVRETLIAPPAQSPPDTALHDAATLDATDDAVLAIPADHHRVLFAARPHDGPIAAPTLAHQSPALLLDGSLLRGTPPVALVRENAWQGPLRLLDPTRAVEAVAPPPLDDAWRLLFARVRTARAIFMRHENTAGALAARPEAPTDPRMPAIISGRNRLRSRWTSLCEQLQSRTQGLVRHGASPDLSLAVRQVCEIHGDLQLGVPINPAL